MRDKWRPIVELREAQQAKLDELRRKIAELRKLRGEADVIPFRRRRDART